MSDGYRLRTPESWTDFRLAEESDENRIARDCWDQAIAAGLSQQQAGEFTESVRRNVRMARRTGALHAAGTFELTEEGPMIATVLVSLVVPPPGGELLDALFGVQHPERADGSWRRVGTAEIEGVGVVGRVHGVQRVLIDDHPVPSAVMHTVVPLPGEQTMLIVTGSSPNVAEAEEMFELFAAITATLELV
ncbi:hypothetical protein [Actinoplanes sp. NPDC051494]|uniref:hypothetical protein n=1 Tax=Actinoplanes sp. NPDC051494 TaxID=3363907 RepID=UPI0037B36B6B